MCQYSSVFFGNSTKIKYEKVCISPNNISNGYKIIKLITRFWEARREPDSKKREWFCMQCRNIFRNVRSFPDAGSLFHPSKKPGRKTARLKYFQHQKSVVPPPKNSPMPRGARDIAPARTRLPYNRTPATASVSPAARAAPARPRPPKRRQRRNPNARPTPRWTAKSPWRRKTRTPTDRPQRPRKPPPHAPAPGTAPARRRTVQRTTVKTAASVSASTR